MDRLDTKSVDRGGDQIAEGSHPRPVRPRVSSLDELAGLKEVKDELRHQIRLWADPEPLRRLGGRPRIGFIFCGPPGSGKTTAAHALASETSRPLYTLSGADFSDESGHERLAAVLHDVVQLEGVVFIDEADDLLHVRDFDEESSSSLVKFLLAALDQTAHDIRAFFVLATNMAPARVDPALCHAARLGRPLEFRPLEADERAELLQARASNYAIAGGVQLRPIAERSADLPAADLAHLFDEAAYVAYRSGHDAIGLEDINEAVARLRSGLGKGRPMHAEDVRRTAVHEAGHAIVRLILQGRWDAVGFIEVNRRDAGQLGITEVDELRMLSRSRDQIVGHLAEGLAGRAAEEMVLRDISAGASSDLERVNHLADRAVSEWGLGSRGARTMFGHYPGDVVEGRIDESASEFVGEADAIARELLTSNLEALECLAEHLTEERSADTQRLRAWLRKLLPRLS
jgi:cell division protease FtsH